MVKANGPAASPSAELLYERVARGVSEQITRGILRPGDRVPSVRQLKKQFDVSQSTAVKALVELEARSLVEARPRSGFYVAPSRTPRELPQSKEKGPKRADLVPSLRPYDVLLNVSCKKEYTPLGEAIPSADLMPHSRLSRNVASANRSLGSKAIMDFDPGGDPEYRLQTARHLAEAGHWVSPDDVIATIGCTEALSLSLLSVAQRGDTVIVESPTYFGFLQILKAQGLKALEIPCHPCTGMNLDLMEQAIGNKPPAACLISPNFSNPLGSLMPEENRRRLLDICKKHHVPLIEDLVYSDLSHQGETLPSLAALAGSEGDVISCGGYSKTLAPGFRAGWCVPGKYAENILHFKRASTLASPILLHHAVAQFLKDGHYTRHLRMMQRKVRQQVAQMQQSVSDSFPAGTRLSCPQGGFVLWVEMPEGIDSLQLMTDALNDMISIAPGPMFSASGQHKNCIRLNCGHPWTPALERAVARLGLLAKQQLSANN